MSSISVLTETYRVRADQSDVKGRIHVYALAGLFQEIAGVHATLLGWGYDDMTANHRAWMLSRLGIRILKIPMWREKIHIHTWVRKTDRLFSYRDFEVLNEAGESLVKASTAWLMLDTQTRRLMRVDVVKEAFIHLPDKIAFSDDIPKIAPLENHIASDSFKVVYSDLDMIGHANNIKYIQWIFDSYEKEEQENKQAKLFTINYLNEALFMDKLSVHTAIKDAKVMHEIIREKDMKILCRGEVEWKE